MWFTRLSYIFSWLVLRACAGTFDLNILYFPIDIYSDPYSVHGKGSLAATKFAVDYINQNTNLLKSLLVNNYPLTLNLSVLDTRIDDPNDEEAYNNFGKGMIMFDDVMKHGAEFGLNSQLDDVTPLVMLGPNSNTEAKYLAMFINAWYVPHISHAVDSSEQSNRDKYPYFLRTSVPFSIFLDPTIELMLSEWSTTRIFYEKRSELMSGITEQFAEDLKTSYEIQGVDIKDYSPFESNENITTVVRNLVEAKSFRVNHIIFSSVLGVRVICEAAKQGVTGRNGWLWIINHFNFNDHWLDISEINSDEYDGCTSELLNEGLAGSLIFDFVDTKSLKAQTGAIHNMSKEELISNFEASVRANYDSSFVYQEDQLGNYVWEAFDAVWAVALALANIETRLFATSETLVFYKANNQFRESLFNVIFDEILAINFTGALGQVAFDPLTGYRQSNIHMAQFSSDRYTSNVVAERMFYHSGLQKVAPYNWATPDGKKPTDEAPDETVFIALGVTGGVIILVVLTWASVYLYYVKVYKPKQEMLNLSWKIDESEIDTKPIFDYASMHSIGELDLQELIDDYEVVLPYRLIHYKGRVVCLYPIIEPVPDTNDVEILKEFKDMKNMKNEYLSPFIGCIVGSENLNGVVSDFGGKGSLTEMFLRSKIKFDEMFQFSIIKDLAEGMDYLHNRTQIKYHGRLRSLAIMVDNRFIPKIGDFGLPSLKPSFVANAEKVELLWTAPEILRNPLVLGTQEADVYSFGIILTEVLFWKPAYYDELRTITALEITRTIKKGTQPPMRPKINVSTISTTTYNLIRSCLSEQPGDRPHFKMVMDDITVIMNEQSIDITNLMENLLFRMEQYASNLENVVAEKTTQFLEEKKRSEELLYSILPPSIAESIKRGERVEPELFDSCTIYFSDIVGFTALSSQSTAIQVVDLLNSLYITFDSITQSYDAYKLETIGDAYQVCSGIPQRNGYEHSRIMSILSLHLLYRLGFFRIAHQPNKQLKIRIGLHSGPVVAGVVGQFMPRYCLFGDTVHVAEKMESGGEPLRVHISEYTKLLLDRVAPGQFELEERGLRSIKGNELLTFFIVKDRNEENRNQPSHWPFTREELMAK